jgi:acetyl-CoA C-acetyltransferase
MGNVLPAGQSQAPARGAAAKLPDRHRRHHDQQGLRLRHEGHLLADIINAGSASIVLSGGMETWLHLSAGQARGGYRAGHDRIIDHMMMDGPEDACGTRRSMGDFGEATAEAYQFTRKDEDAYAMETLTRAQGGQRRVQAGRADH